MTLPVDAQSDRAVDLCSRGGRASLAVRRTLAPAYLRERVSLRSAVSGRSIYSWPAAPRDRSSDLSPAASGESQRVRPACIECSQGLSGERSACPESAASAPFCIHKHDRRESPSPARRPASTSENSVQERSTPCARSSPRRPRNHRADSGTEAKTIPTGA